MSEVMRLPAKTRPLKMRGLAYRVVGQRGISEKRTFEEPLFLPMSFFVGLRGGSAMLFSEPLALSCKTPRFFDVKFCWQAHDLRGLCVRSHAPASENYTPENEGLGL